MSSKRQLSSRKSAALLPLRAGFMFALAALLPAIAAPARAEPCLAPAAIGFSAECRAALPRSHLDAARIVEAAPTQAEVWTDGAPWISLTAPTPPTVAPVAVNPTSGGASMRASFSQIRDYNAKLAGGKIDAAKAVAPSTAPSVVAASAMNSPLDVWTTFDVQGLERETDHGMRASVGADYKLSSQAVVGIAAERGETDAATQPKDDHKLAAFVAFRAAPALTVGARTEWGSATPAFGDKAEEKGSVSVAPRLGRSFALGQGGETIEPFLTYRHTIGLDDIHAGAARGVATTESAGAGVTYAKPDAYSISVTTDVENAGASDPANVNGRLQFKLPIQ